MATAKSLEVVPWPPASGLTSRVVPRPAILSISASTQIAAPAALILSILRSISAYSTWNTFCPTVHIHSQPPGIQENEKEMLHVGTSFTLDVIMDAKKPDSVTPTQCRVTDISTPERTSGYVPKEVLEGDGSYEKDQGRVYRISWTTEGGFVARGLKSERISEVIDLGNGKVKYRTWECQGGVLARVVKWKFEKVLGEKFELWSEDLKKEAEKQAAEGG